MQPYLYIVKVNGTQTEYSEQNQAMAHYNEERSKGNHAELIRYNIANGTSQRYNPNPKQICNCVSCKPKRIQYKPRMIK